ncbi:holo-ACP synthase [Parachitinimonas caeni]|uniref:Holo-[acyl-carrier-protein] synthase n=1 Tax=Parachitinimonas caeni TaxID=3031301 RepID=A0ABT7DW15_9NEIS|nr:holo-ACP synthase [Parachitinimonas caeni]MDK2124241.1 holo-ACP synthase [Parachitinimonas caeni]
MIYGIGTDLVENARIAELYEKYGDRFLGQILTEAERAEFVQAKQPVAFLAKRFAAKEAFAKALGTGIRHPVSFGKIGVGHEKGGRPLLQFDDSVRDLMAERGVSRAHLSISDEHSMTAAFVVLEASQGVSA